MSKEKYKYDAVPCNVGCVGCVGCAFEHVPCESASNELIEKFGLPECNERTDAAPNGYIYVVKENIPSVKLYAVEDNDCKGCVFQHADYKICNEFQNIAPILKLPECGVKYDHIEPGYVSYIYVTKKPKAE